MKVKIGVSDFEHNIFLPFFIQISNKLCQIENQLDSDNEKEEETKKAKASAKFDDEDQVDPLEVAK